VTLTSSGAQTSTLTATTTGNTTSGIYQIAVTGTSGSITETTTVCVDVTGSSTGTCTSTAAVSGEFYILNGGTGGSISGYTISSGKLTKVGSSVSLSGVAPIATAIAPNGKFLLVSSSVGTSGVVYAYPITNGALGTGVLVTQDIASAIQIDSTNSWLIEAIPFTGGTGGVILSAVPINSNVGTFTSAAIPSATITVAGATLPNGQMVISGDNKEIFVALEAGGTTIVPFDSTNPFPSGTKTLVISPAHGGSDQSVAVDPGTTPRLFYIGETLGNAAGNAGGLRAFTYASLSTASSNTPPSDAAGSPIASGGLAPTFILPAASGNNVYVADGAGSITGFSITAGSSSTYTVATVGNVPAGAQPLGLAEDSTGSYVFEVGSSGSPYFDAYSFDPNTAGQLDSQVTSTSAATSIAIVAVPQ
jgi:6-phosphogluconolactonase (cycloisomerase 2 family)